MISVSNIRIGTKLTVTSGLGILLVAGMLAGQLLGNAPVETADESAATPTSLPATTQPAPERSATAPEPAPAARMQTALATALHAETEWKDV